MDSIGRENGLDWDGIDAFILLEYRCFCSTGPEYDHSSN